MLSTVISNFFGEEDDAGVRDCEGGDCVCADAAGSKIKSAATKAATMDTLFLFGIIFRRMARARRDGASATLGAARRRTRGDGS